MALLTKREDTVRDCIMLSLLIQMLFLTMAAMLLDGGQTFQIVSYAAIAYWAGFAVMFGRRRRCLTKTDKMLIRWGFLMLVFVSSFITGLIWHLRGF
jgi:hypothetical protein